MHKITEAETLRKIKMAAKYLPPLDIADQQAIVFNYRTALQVILILLERIEELNKALRLKDKGNSDLSRIIEDCIIKDRQERKKRV